jgi:hypothetical protein
MKTSVIPALVAGLLVSGAVQAAVIQGPTNPGNDCGAGGFAACNATTTGTNMNGSAGPGSPVIFKRNSSGDDDQPTGSTDLGGFPTVTGSEFNITYDAVDKILSFTYTPGAGDPEIHLFGLGLAGLGAAMRRRRQAG